MYRQQMHNVRCKKEPKIKSLFDLYQSLNTRKLSFNVAQTFMCIIKKLHFFLKDFIFTQYENLCYTIYSQHLF